jgi:hypothetical protein
MRVYPIRLFALLLGGFRITLGGCETPPTAEMESAEAAFIRAENDPDAAAFAGTSLLRAREARSRMRAEAEAKRYDAARSFAAEVVAASEKAINDGRNAAGRAREEAAALAGSLKNTLRETESALEKARDTDKLDLDFNALARDIEAARNLAAAAENALAQGRPNEALREGNAARSALGDIMYRISQGVRAVTRRK